MSLNSSRSASWRDKFLFLVSYRENSISVIVRMPGSSSCNDSKESDYALYKLDQLVYVDI